MIDDLDLAALARAYPRKTEPSGKQEATPAFIGRLVAEQKIFTIGREAARNPRLWALATGKADSIGAPLIVYDVETYEESADDGVIVVPASARSDVRQYEALTRAAAAHGKVSRLEGDIG